jgi:hypothetical protein
MIEMKVKTIVRFKDLKEDKIREIGETFIISKKRADEILRKGAYIEEIKEDNKKKEKSEGGK